MLFLFPAPLLQETKWNSDADLPKKGLIALHQSTFTQIEMLVVVTCNGLSMIFIRPRSSSYIRDARESKPLLHNFRLIGLEAQTKCFTFPPGMDQIGQPCNGCLQLIPSLKLHQAPCNFADPWRKHSGDARFSILEPVVSWWSLRSAIFYRNRLLAGRKVGATFFFPSSFCHFELKPRVT